MFDRLKALFSAPRPAMPTPLSEDQVAAWQRDGYLVLPSFMSDETIDQINRLVGTLATSENRQAFADLTIDPLTGPMAGRRLRIGDAPDDVFNVPIKINDLFLRSDLIRGVVLAPDLSAILAQLLEGEPTVCNSLNFVRGSEQHLHVDTWFMPPPDERRLIVSSICLEDVHPDAGPLVYYPGSHVIPPYRFADGRLNGTAEELPKSIDYVRQEVEARGLAKEKFLGRKGDVFLWHAQLVHGGEPIADTGRTRRSLVTHYWARDDLNGFEVETIAPGQHYWRRDPLPADSAA